MRHRNVQVRAPRFFLEKLASPRECHRVMYLGRVPIICIETENRIMIVFPARDAIAGNQ
jgi:hypothetical protein